MEETNERRSLGDFSSATAGSRRASQVEMRILQKKIVNKTKKKIQTARRGEWWKERGRRGKEARGASAISACKNFRLRLHRWRNHARPLASDHAAKWRVGIIQSDSLECRGLSLGCLFEFSAGCLSLIDSKDDPSMYGGGFYIRSPLLSTRIQSIISRTSSFSCSGQ